MVIETLKKIGSLADSIGEKILELIPPKLLESPTSAKILSVLIYALMVYVVLHFATAIRKPIAYIIVILLALLIISIITTFIP